MALNAEGIFRAALRLVDAEGIEALTMRRLASELGVAPMSLYGHVPTKEHLLLGLVNMVTKEIALPGPDTPPWEALRGVTRNFRQVALQHPNLVPLIMRQPPTGSEGLLTLEVALDALRRAGLPPDLTAKAYRMNASFAIGRVSLEAGGFFRPVDIAAGDDVAPADVSSLPRVVEMAPFLAAWDADEEFERAMDDLISVFQAWVVSAGAGQVVEDDGGGRGDVERVDVGAHGNPDPAVSVP
jgi:TetR/AcrR family tetracycline transcriptional repressor